MTVKEFAERAEISLSLAYLLRTYPSRPADRYVIQAQTKCNIPK